MDLDEAIGRISDIRVQLARTETFRGFRSVTTGFTGLFGIVAAVIQANSIAQPVERVWEYLNLWVGVALLNLLVVGSELAYRWSSTDSPLKRRLTIEAIRRFSPCLLAGGALTAVVATCAPEIAWVLPGLWALFFSLGLLACGRLLPRAMSWVGAYYMASGTVCLALGDGAHSLSPWLMVGTFGTGQFLAAGILAYTLEGGHEQG
jgi:hypothetical protein